jgi:hypothetical protein
MHLFPFGDLGFAHWNIIIEKVLFFIFVLFKFWFFAFWVAENHGKGNENLEYFE